MIAAGLFFQLSNLQAMTQDQSAALNEALAKLSIQGDLKTSKKPRAQIVTDITNLNITDEVLKESLAYALSDSPTSIKDSSVLLKNANKDFVTEIQRRIAAMGQAPVDHEADEDLDGSTKQNAATHDELTAQLQALTAHANDLQEKLEKAETALGNHDELTAQLEHATAERTDLQQKLEKAETALPEANNNINILKAATQKAQTELAQVKAAAAAKDKDLTDTKAKLAQLEAKMTASDKDLTDAKTKLADLQAKIAGSDKDIVALVDAAKNGEGSVKYIPLAEKAAHSLKDAIDAISDAAVKSDVENAVKAILSPSASASSAKQSSNNLGRLGSKKSNKKGRA